MHLKMLSAEVACCIQMFKPLTNFGRQTNSVVPDQTAPIEKVWPEPLKRHLFAADDNKKKYAVFFKNNK